MSIVTFWPENTPTELWIENYNNDHKLTDVIEKAKEHFGASFDMDKLVLSPEYIHTNCITYDQYDPSDYTRFLKITLE
jgi:hypothetical protein